MFADSMLDVSWAQRTRRGWSTVTSFGLQAVVMGLLLLLPLWKTVGLPTLRTVSAPIALGRPSAEPAPRPTAAGASDAPNNFAGIHLTQPGRIPNVITTGVGPAEPLPPGGPGTGLEGIGLPSGVPNGLPLSIVSGTTPVIPAAPRPTVHPFRISTMLEGNLIRRVQPAYPPLAKRARVQGPVVLEAVISKAGTIEGLHALSGHPMLIKAAIDAVGQWRYRPYILNGEPIEVETQITVNFILSGN